MSEEIELGGPSFISVGTETGREKLMIGLGKNGRHLTFMAKGNKDTYDVHHIGKAKKKAYSAAGASEATCA